MSDPTTTPTNEQQDARGGATRYDECGPASAECDECNPPLWAAIYEALVQAHVTAIETRGDALRLSTDAVLASVSDVPALLDALDAAEEENERLRATTERLHDDVKVRYMHFRAHVIAHHGAQPWTENEQARHGDLPPHVCGVTCRNPEADAARAALAALRGRIEALHRPDDHGPGRCDKAECFTSCVECGDDWPCATIRALAADEGERTGR